MISQSGKTRKSYIKLKKQENHQSNIFISQIKKTTTSTFCIYGMKK
jgi:hypothetical protein